MIIEGRETVSNEVWCQFTTGKPLTNLKLTFNYYENCSSRIQSMVGNLYIKKYDDDTVKTCIYIHTHTHTLMPAVTENWISCIHKTANNWYLVLFACVLRLDIACLELLALTKRFDILHHKATTLVSPPRFSSFTS
jgi:hypothetical protein